MSTSSGNREAEPVRLGVSACLLGEQVRYDGGHKCNRYLLECFAEVAIFFPVCPEVGAGMGTPREPLHLIHTPAGVRMRGSQSGTDWTVALESYAREVLAGLEEADLDGFVLMSRSPSCGLGGVRLYDEGGNVRRDTTSGLFAAAVRRVWPELPVIESEHLADPLLRDAFLDAAFAYRRCKY